MCVCFRSIIITRFGECGSHFWSHLKMKPKMVSDPGPWT